jgi:hypothetical protein
LYYSILDATQIIENLKQHLTHALERVSELSKENRELKATNEALARGLGCGKGQCSKNL